MELGAYPFSERYAWVQDRYGLTWQLMFVGDRPITQPITPTLMFVGEQCGNAEPAIELYTSVFRHSKIGGILRYGKGEEPDKEGTIKHAEFVLEDQGFASMDSAYEHTFAFNEAISFMVHCDTQPWGDYFGSLKDRFGVMWMINYEYPKK